MSTEKQYSLLLCCSAVLSSPAYPKGISLLSGLDVTLVLPSELCCCSGLLDLNTTILKNLYVHEEMFMIYGLGVGDGLDNYIDHDSNF